MADIVVFGLGQIAEVAWFYLTHDSDHRIVAFTVDRAYLDRTEWKGIPVVAWEDVENQYPPDRFKLFLPIAYAKVNRFREERFLDAKQKGYSCISYVSSKATVWPGLEIGENCFIFEDNTIQPFTRIGDNVVLWSGNHIGHHSTIGDHVFLASHIVVSGAVRVGNRTFIGVNATLRDNIEIGSDCVIGAGALVLKSLEQGSVVVGQASALLEKKSHELKRL